MIMPRVGSEGELPPIYGVWGGVARLGDSGFTVGEFEPGPVVVDRTDFIVDQIGFESGLADVVLVEVNLIFAGAFGVDEPDVSRFWKTRRDHIQGRGEVA